MHIERGGHWFGIWLESLSGQVKRYIKEVDNFFIRFNGDSQVVIGEYFAYFFLHFFNLLGGLI